MSLFEEFIISITRAMVWFFDFWGWEAREIEVHARLFWCSTGRLAAVDSVFEMAIVVITILPATRNPSKLMVAGTSYRQLDEFRRRQCLRTGDTCHHHPASDS